VCQSPKIRRFSAGSRRRTLVCFHPFRQVLQYTVVEVTPITRRFYPVRARHAVSSQPVPPIPHSQAYELVTSLIYLQLYHVRVGLAEVRRQNECGAGRRWPASTFRCHAVEVTCSLVNPRRHLTTAHAGSRWTGMGHQLSRITPLEQSPQKVCGASDRAGPRRRGCRLR
jgi:hypothetical protein